MPPVKLKVSRIGNSRGVRLPAAVLHRYEIGEEVLMEELPDGILLRPQGVPARLSWDDTARAMAAEGEDWGAWDSTTGDGIAGIPWTGGRIARVAEPRPQYSAPKRRKK
jgi:antitoxin MazE